MKFRASIDRCKFFSNPTVEVFKMILLYIHGYGIPHIKNTFIISFFRRKRIMHQQSTLNEKDKIIKNKHIDNNTKSVIKRYLSCGC